ncbi:MAG: hypothetical protein A2Y41_08965 [Spirochaetes bacterium GWB1_36_13]|nr:MAG: hypothetical protein A2Y41_08965 [Spirochaetes bacterium GWB1_36_13]
MKAICCLVLFLVPFSLFSADKNDYYQLIQKTYQTGQYQEAISKMEKALDEYPDEADFYSNLIFFYMHAKEYEKAFPLSQKAYQKFPSHKFVLDAVRWVWSEYGWKFYREGQKKEAYALFEKNYALFPEDIYCINAYGVLLKEKKDYPKAIQIFESGLKKQPDFNYILENLSWTYYEYGSEFLDSGNQEKAFFYFQKAFEKGNKENPATYTAYLYKLSHLKKLDLGINTILPEAIQKFGFADDVYQSGFWLYFHNALFYQDSLFQDNHFSKMLNALKDLYQFSTRKKMPYINDPHISFEQAAISLFNNLLKSSVQKICPYWRKLNSQDEKKLSEALKLLKKDLPKNLNFLSSQLLGLTLYREGKKKEARAELEKTYQMALKLVEMEKVVISFPLKGMYCAGNNESFDSVTHMGLDQYSYDFYGCDESGDMLKNKKIKPENSSNEDWLGYNALIYSPVEGKVIDSQGENPDDPPFLKELGKGNFIYLQSSDGKIYDFYHLKQGSLLVQKGDEVKKDQPIARLGNSESFFPHLHFAVYSRDWLITYPVYFTNYTLIKNGKKEKVKEGRPGGIGGMDVILN